MSLLTLLIPIAALAADLPSPVEEKCRNFILSKAPATGGEDYMQDVRFQYRKKKVHRLTEAHGFLNPDTFQFPKESVCSMTGVYPRKDGTFWILGLESDPPHHSYLRAYVYSPKKDEIVGRHRGVNFYKPVTVSGDDLLYASTIPRSDLAGGLYKLNRREVRCLENELPLIHRLTFKDGRFEDRLDKKETFERFAHKALFRDQADFEKYFALSEPEDGPKIRRWVYALENEVNPDCIVAANRSTKRDCSDLKSEAVRCKKR